MRDQAWRVVIPGNLVDIDFLESKPIETFISIGPVAIGRIFSIARSFNYLCT